MLVPLPIFGYIVKEVLEEGEVVKSVLNNLVKRF